MFQTYTKETQQKAVGRLAIQHTGGTTGKLDCYGNSQVLTYTWSP